MQKSPFKIAGIVKNHGTHAGIGDLVVTAIDIDFQAEGQTDARKSLENSLAYDRLGSVLTDSRGQFSLEFTEEDFKRNDTDRRPELLLVVSAPEISGAEPFTALTPYSLNRQILHVSPPIRLRAGRIESYSIRLTQEVLNRFGISESPRTDWPDPAVVASNLERKSLLQRDMLRARIADFTRRTQEFDDLARAADSLFAGFRLSKLPASVLAKDTFHTPDKNLGSLVGNLFSAGLARFESGSPPRRMSLSLSPDRARELGLLSSSGTIAGTFGTAALWDWWRRRNDTILERRPGPVESCLAPFSEADLGPVESPVPDSPVPDSPPSGEPSAPALPAAPLSAEESLAALGARAHRLTECMTCPEAPLLYSRMIDPAYREVELQDTVDGLSLKGGPTDVASYHDFDSIQLAFETVWTEVFDETIGNLGKEIFAEIVRTADDTCADGLIRASRLSLSDPSSLKSLLREYRSITGSRINSRLERLFNDLEERLAEPYKFDVFAADSYNFGVIHTFRQKWEPLSYQVGRMVKTVPLAPKEVRKYRTKTTRKLSKTLKELEDREFKGSSESSSTSRAESEIVNRATNKTSFQTTANTQMDMQMINMQFGMTTGMEAEKFSSATKKNFRESVMKAAQEYRKQTKLEVETVSETQSEMESSGEISNPNDEIAVTYLFYELQRQYNISEKLHRITPVIAVAFAVPKPHEIDNDWLISHAWIIRRVLLDEGFHAALDYLTTSLAGSEIALQEMGNALRKQQKLVDEINRQLELKNQYTQRLMDQIVGVMTGDAVIDTVKDTADFVHGLLNPLAGLFGGGGGDSGPDLEKFKEVLELQLERSEKEQQRLETRLRESQSDLQSITQKFSELTRQHFDRQTAIAQLRIHVKENILYYMHAIWDYEPHDQRYFRLYDLEVEWFEDPDAPVSTGTLVPRRNPATGEIEWIEGDIVLPMGGVRRTTRKLVDIADLDNLVGFKGNYAIFPVKEPNYVHLYMMGEYIDTQTGGVRDPDAFADLSTEDLIRYLKCVRVNNPARYEDEKDRIIGLINERRGSPRKEKELVVVPTDCLYLECLPGRHPVLEDFKLVHRAVDVKKAQAEARKLELENLRYASRLVQNRIADPEVDKHIRIQGGVSGMDIDT